MQLKPIIQGLAAIWVVVFAVSFLSLRGGEVDEDFASLLSRVAAFLTWQVAAFGVAAVGTLTTRHAVARGTRNVKVFGYTPLAISVFVIASFVVVLAARFVLVPAFSST
jgi:hypothetical protein